MSTFRVQPSPPVKGTLCVPGDKSISHRAAILGGLSNGVCHVRNFLPSEDCLCTLYAMEKLGAKVEVLSPEGQAPTELKITGTNMRLQSPAEDLDCGNAGTGMRLLAGVLAGQGSVSCEDPSNPFQARLIGDESLSSRPMGRVIRPLTEMGGTLISEGQPEGCAPLLIRGEQPLQGITYEMPVASAQVKSAILLAALTTPEKTTVIQPAPTRDHTERMLNDMGIEVTTVDQGHRQLISLTGGKVPEARDLIVPGDISSAAFWLVAASASPGAELTITDVGLNPTRVAIITFLQRMGADITILGDKAHDEKGEPLGDLLIKGTTLQGTDLLEAEVPNLIDEIPVLSLAAVLAEGRTTFRNAKELRVKETDRIDTTVRNWKNLGIEVDEFEDGLEINGGQSIQGGETESYGDHRIAMTFAIAGLFAQSEVTVHNTDCVNTSYPSFQDHLNQFTAK